MINENVYGNATISAADDLASVSEQIGSAYCQMSNKSLRNIGKRLIQSSIRIKQMNVFPTLINELSDELNETSDIIMDVAEKEMEGISPYGVFDDLVEVYRMAENAIEDEKIHNII